MDDLTPEEVALAALQGWQLCRVYHQEKRRWSVMVLPLRFGTAHLPTADAAAIHVVGLARSGQQLAAKALGLVMASHTPPPKGKKK